MYCEIYKVILSLTVPLYEVFSDISDSVERRRALRESATLFFQADVAAFEEQSTRKRLPRYAAKSVWGGGAHRRAERHNNATV